MSKKMDIYTELDNFVEENEGQVTLTDVAKHFTDYGYQRAVEETHKWLSMQKELVGISFEKDFYERYKQFMSDGKL